MKRNGLIVSIIVVCLVSYLGFLKAGAKMYNVSSITSLVNVESLANPEDEFEISCSGGAYGDCQLFELYFCANGNQAAHCYKTGNPKDYCSAIMVIICTIGGISPHPRSLINEK